MNDNELVNFARSRFDHESHKRLLKEKYESKLLFAYKGGMFRAGFELITFLKCFDHAHMVIKDLYDTPVEVNVQELLNLANERYMEQMNAWLVEYESTRNQR
jgi:hypothetical protein